MYDCSSQSNLTIFDNNQSANDNEKKSNNENIRIEMSFTR
jgi:hypothetical protein